MRFLNFINGYKKITMYLVGILTVFLQNELGINTAQVWEIVVLCSGGVVGQGIADAGGKDILALFQK